MRLPFFYGWLIVAVVFVSMGIGVNARTAFSLLFPPILDEFGWERGVTAGAFSFGFLVSAVMSPLLGRMMDRVGPRVVMELGVGLMAAGLLLAPLTTRALAALRHARRAGRRAAASALAIPASRCSCRTGSCAGAGWRRASPSPASASARSCCCPPSSSSSRAPAGARHAGPWACWCWSCWRRSTCCCASGPRTWGCSRTATPRRTGCGRRQAVQRRRPGLGGDRLDARPRDAHRALLVDRARLLLRALRLVRRAGAPDQVSDRDRLQPDHGGLGAGPRQPARHSRARSRSATSPTAIGREWVWTVGMLGLRRLLRGAAAAAGVSQYRCCSTLMVVGAGRARLRRHLGVRRHRRRDLPGQALRHHLRHADAGGDRRRRAGPVGHGRAVRRPGQLHAGLLDRRGSERCCRCWRSGMAAPRKVRAVAGQMHRLPASG